MFQFGKHSVVVAAASNAPVVPATDLRVESQAGRRRYSVRVLMEIRVSRQASHIPQCRYPLIAQVILSIEREMMCEHSWEISGKNAHIDLARCRQSIRAEGRHCVR